MSILKNKAPEATYSAFWPVLSVFAAVAALQGMNIIDDVRQHRELVSQLASVQQILPRAKTIDKSVEEVSNELLMLAENNKDQAAAKIIAEFGIQRNPAGAAAAAAKRK